MTSNNCVKSSEYKLTEVTNISCSFLEKKQPNLLLEKKALSSFEKRGNEFCSLFSTYDLNEWLMKQNQNLKFNQGSARTHSEVYIKPVQKNLKLGEDFNINTGISKGKMNILKVTVSETVYYINTCRKLSERINTVYGRL